MKMRQAPNGQARAMNDLAKSLRSDLKLVRQRLERVKLIYESDAPKGRVRAMNDLADSMNQSLQASKQRLSGAEARIARLHLRLARVESERLQR